ncbi:MAG TPA: hypothetical protein G4O19_03420 [Dehalococcoidia bacterium]|nr:hypothetical protein [Dehalococcoidia bacterium]
MRKSTKYTKSHNLILEAMAIPFESYPRIIKKMKDRDLYLLMSELNQACNQIVEAVSNTTKFEVKPTPAQFEDAEKLRPVIQEMQKELELRLNE